MESLHFKIPDFPFASIFWSKIYRNVLFDFLENNGIDREVLKKLERSIFNDFLSSHNNDGKLHKKLEDHDFIFCTKYLKDKFGKELFKKIDKLTIKFLKEKSSFKEGESYLDGLINIARKYSLPIYGTDGEIIWPKELSYDQI